MYSDIKMVNIRVVCFQQLLMPDDDDDGPEHTPFTGAAKVEVNGRRAAGGGGGGGEPSSVDNTTLPTSQGPEMNEKYKQKKNIQIKSHFK